MDPRGIRRILAGKFKEEGEIFNSNPVFSKR